VNVTTQAKPVCVVGNLTLDDTFTGSDSMLAALGGDALYAALGLRWWGCTVSIVSRVGEDYPQSHLDQMQAAGIAIDRIRAMPGPTVHYRVTYDAEGQRVFEHLTPPERLDELSPTGAELDALETAGWVHVAAMPIERQAEAVNRANSAGVPFSLDPHEEYVSGYQSQLSELIAGGVFLPSELELNLLWPGVSMEEALARFAKLGSRAAAIKRGVEGSCAGMQQRTWSVPSLPVSVVDPTGAGDAYCGGFVAGFLATSSALGGAACGTVAAAHIVQGFGAFHSPAPSRDWMQSSVRRLLAGRYDGEGDRLLTLLSRV
jgi:sugar/nucleoside kinase (ribokinase family)